MQRQTAFCVCQRETENVEDLVLSQEDNPKTHRLNREISCETGIHWLTDCTQNNLSWSAFCSSTVSNDVTHSSCLKPIALPVWLAASSCCKIQFDFIWFRDKKCLLSNHHSTRRTITFMHQSVPRSDTLIPAVCYACANIQQVGYGVRCRVNSGYDWTDIFWIDPRMKVNGQYCCDVLLSQQMLPAVKRSQNVVYSQSNMLLTAKCHFLCSVISQGKVVVLDRWGGKWNQLSMMRGLNTDCAKNYCNRTLIVKVIVENVVTCFFMGHSVVLMMRACIMQGYFSTWYMEWMDITKLSVTATNERNTFISIGYPANWL